jgi:hypothetical protein
VLNLSVIGMGSIAMTEVVPCMLKRSPVRPKMILVEIPVIIDADAAVTSTKSPSVESCIVQSPFRYFAGRLFGLNWVQFLRDEYQGRRDPRTAQLSPLPSDYIVNSETFKKIEPFLWKERARLLGMLKEEAQTVVAYPSPMWIDGLTKLGFDQSNLEEQIQSAVKACRQIGGVICLDTSPLSSNASLYLNVGHLGLAGHAFFAKWLMERVPATGQ